MPRLTSFFVLLCLLGTWLGVAVATSSADSLNQDEVLALRRAGDVAPFQTILQSASRRYPNLQVLEVELEAEDGAYLYEIDILLDDGTIRELEVDAFTGTILEDELED